MLTELLHNSPFQRSAAASKQGRAMWGASRVVPTPAPVTDILANSSQPPMQRGQRVAWPHPPSPWLARLTLQCTPAPGLLGSFREGTAAHASPSTPPTCEPAAEPARRPQPGSAPHSAPGCVHFLAHANVLPLCGEQAQNTALDDEEDEPAEWATAPGRISRARVPVGGSGPEEKAGGANAGAADDSRAGLPSIPSTGSSPLTLRPPQCSRTSTSG